MRYAGIIGGLVFCLFTYWQLNDLDQYGTKWWEGWVLAYMLVALVSFVSAFRRLPVWIYGIGIAIAVGRGIQRFVAIEWEKTVLYNESNPAGNETGGLLIVAIWLGVLWWLQRRKR